MKGVSQPNKMDVNTFVFLDLETTGLQRPIEITEMTFLAIHHDEMRKRPRSAEKLPRITDKLTVCINPVQNIEPHAEKLTGLQKEALSNKGKFDIHLGQMLLSLLDRQVKPVCLVAHNGEEFDFGVLQSELETIGLTIPNDVYFADSLKGFREIRNNFQGKESYAKQSIPLLGNLLKDTSLSLQNIATLLLTDHVTEAHTSESDTLTLAKLVCKYDEIRCWLNCNAKPFQTFANDKIENNLFKVKGWHPDCQSRIMAQDEYFNNMEE